MPSKFTENYNLSQWDASDRVHHEDFNADNLAIDAALLGKLGQVELPREYISDSYESHIFATAIDGAENWSITGFLFHAEKLEGDKNPQFQIYVRSPDGNHRVLGVFDTTPVLVVFFPLHDENRMISGVIFGANTVPFLLDIPYKGYQNGWINRLGSTVFKNALIRYFGIR